eukprot:6148754-Alexandrium_andersonii.AAC.1
MCIRDRLETAPGWAVRSRQTPNMAGDRWHQAIVHRSHVRQRLRGIEAQGIVVGRPTPNHGLNEFVLAGQLSGGELPMVKLLNAKCNLTTGARVLP